MKRGTIAILLATAAILALLWALGSAIASPPQEGPEGEVGVRIAGVVDSQINFQGRLTDADGNPLDGTYMMCFSYWDARTGGSQLTSECRSVDVQDGLFSIISLGAPQNIFNGQGLWLRVTVEGEELTPRQEILPVPYALSLRPGANIREDDVIHPVLTVQNGSPGVTITPSKVAIEALTSNGAALWGIAGSGVGVQGTVASAGGYGGYFNNTANGGTGVYAQGGGDAGADLVLGGTAGADDGRIYSDPAYAGSDILLFSNDEVWIDLDDDGNEDGHFIIRNGANTNVFEVDESGNVAYDGALSGAFPRPAYDSGWVNISQGEVKTLTHGLGGDTDNYVVDLQFKDTDGGGYGINHLSYGGEQNASWKWTGAFWHRLTNTTIEVRRHSNDPYANQIRVRIWVYK